MRRDMAKLLVERPRVGNIGSRRDRLTKLTEDSPCFESIRKKWHDHRKSLNENLAPLRRFLRSCVGRSWDEVYSELRQHVRADSAVQLHILQHLWDFVVRHVVLIDGVPCQAGDEERCCRVGRPIRSGQLYVHPESRLLLLVPDEPRRKYQRPPAPRVLPDGRQLHQVAGVWYAVELAPVDRTQVPLRDAVVGLLTWDADWSVLWQTYGCRDRYGVRKQQLGKRALKKLGLR